VGNATSTGSFFGENGVSTAPRTTFNGPSLSGSTRSEQIDQTDTSIVMACPQTSFQFSSYGAAAAAPISNATLTRDFENYRDSSKDDDTDDAVSNVEEESISSEDEFDTRMDTTEEMDIETEYDLDTDMEDINNVMDIDIPEDIDVTIGRLTEIFQVQCTIRGDFFEEFFNIVYDEKGRLLRRSPRLRTFAGGFGSMLLTESADGRVLRRSCRIFAGNR
jgi:hypothetical protein